jgi:drug/metabolite transporter (DMT)-like permease
MLEACEQDCIGMLYSAIDDAAGREPPPFARLWGNIRLVRWIVAAAVFLLFLGLFMTFRPAKPHFNNRGQIVATVFGSGLAMAASFGLVTFGGLIFAPDDFLLNHPAGMKVMTRTGVRRPTGVRIFATILILISCGAMWLSLVILFERG